MVEFETIYFGLAITSLCIAGIGMVYKCIKWWKRDINTPRPMSPTNVSSGISTNL